MKFRFIALIALSMSFNGYTDNTTKYTSDDLRDSSFQQDKEQIQVLEFVQKLNMQVLIKLDKNKLTNKFKKTETVSSDIFWVASTESYAIPAVYPRKNKSLNGKDYFNVTIQHPAKNAYRNSS